MSNYKMQFKNDLLISERKKKPSKPTWPYIKKKYYFPQMQKIQNSGEGVANQECTTQNVSRTHPGGHKRTPNSI